MSHWHGGGARRRSACKARRELPTLAGTRQWAAPPGRLIGAAGGTTAVVSHWTAGAFQSVRPPGSMEDPALVTAERLHPVCNSSSTAGGGGFAGCGLVWWASSVGDRAAPSPCVTENLRHDRQLEWVLGFPLTSTREVLTMFVFVHYGVRALLLLTTLVLLSSSVHARPLPSAFSGLFTSTRP